MIERTFDLEIERAHSELKAILLNKGCKIVSEEWPTHLVIKQGSLSGVSPKSAKKIVSYQTYPHESGTRIVSRSSISSDWAKLTLWGNIVAGIVAAVFWWIAIDITAFVNEGKIGTWTWLANAFGYPDIQYTLFMTNVASALSLFLFIAILFEILDVFIVHRRIEAFAQETLEELTKSSFTKR